MTLPKECKHSRITVWKVPDTGKTSKLVMWGAKCSKCGIMMRAQVRLNEYYSDERAEKSIAELFRLTVGRQ